MVDIKLSYPRQKELAAAQAGEIFLNVQLVSRGGGSEGVDDGACLGKLGATADAQAAQPREKTVKKGL